MGQLVRSLMVGKRARELFKTLKQVQVTVNPFDEKATTARYVLNSFYNINCSTTCHGQTRELYSWRRKFLRARPNTCNCDSITT